MSDHTGPLDGLQQRKQSWRIGVGVEPVVILPTEAYDDWLDPDTDAPTLLALLQPVEWSGMV